MSAPGVSFVVIAFNEEHAIERTLSAIESLNGLGEHEVIVIDDGSTDTTADCVRAFAVSHPAVRVMSQVNQGRGAARHNGLAESKMGIVAMVDADVELPTDWLRRCESVLAEGFSVVGGTAIPEGDATWLYETFRLEPRPNPLKVEITGGNFLATRESLEAVGFDPAMRTAEDVVFVHRMHAEGFKSKVLTDLVCLHREDKGYIGTLKWMLESGISATHQLLRFRPLRSPDLALATWVVASILSFIVFGWLRGTAITMAMLVAIATAHAVRAFRIRASAPYLARLAVACVVNSTILGTYFLGRIVGFFVPNRIARD